MLNAINMKTATQLIISALLTSIAYADQKPLNDTGVLWGATYPSGNNTSCAGSSVDGQDCSHGRDALVQTGAVVKVGTGVAGFDFSKVSNSGATLPPNAALGTNPTDWACTLDNVTGLLWEVKQATGLHSQAHTYSWFNSNAQSNGGQAGTSSGGVCETLGRCDTEKFVADVNAESLCGFNDWRMPTAKELLSIVDYGVTTRIVDTAFFPDLVGAKPYSNPPPLFWAGTPSAGLSTSAQSVSFSFGADGNRDKAYPQKVRLVRAQF